MFLRDLIIKFVDEKSNILFGLNLFDPSEEMEALLIPIKFCPFCQIELSEENFQKFDELDDIECLTVAEGDVAQLRIWDRTGSKPTIQIGYGDYETFKCIREEIVQLIFKYHPPKSLG